MHPTGRSDGLFFVFVMLVTRPVHMIHSSVYVSAFTSLALTQEVCRAFNGQRRGEMRLDVEAITSVLPFYNLLYI